MPSGNIISCQGYEPFALNDLLQKELVKEEDIITGCKNVPEIWYNDDAGKKHRHFVDIFIPSQNRCIEVKSTWTAKKKQDNIYLKQNAGKELGYNYEIWIYNGKGERVENII
jgi:DNA repair protein RadC